MFKFLNFVGIVIDTVFLPNWAGVWHSRGSRILLLPHGEGFTMVDTDIQIEGKDELHAIVHWHFRLVIVPIDDSLDCQLDVAVEQA